MNLLIASDKTKLRTQQISQRYGEVSEELKSIAARLSELHPNTRQVDELHQKFINTLKRFASDGQELKLLFISVNRDLEEVETILALPKNVITENKSRLLIIRDRLMRAETEIQNKLETIKQNERAAMEALDGLETLARKHGASLSR
jgi:chromosome segregation ATPase